MYNKKELAALTSELLGTKIIKFDYIKGGTNNVLAKVDNRDGSFVVKVYFYNEED